MRGSEAKSDLYSIANWLVKMNGYEELSSPTVSGRRRLRLSNVASYDVP